MKEANRIGLWLVEFNLLSNYGILRCTHRTKENLIAAISLVRNINGNRVIFSPIKTSGTIKGIKKNG